jgi:hypothetical protein
LWLVQSALRLGASAIAIRLSQSRVSLYLKVAGSLPEVPPPPSDRLQEVWPQFSRHLEGYEWKRQVSSAQLKRERQSLRQRARYCPVPLKLDGYMVQPETQSFRPQNDKSGVPVGYHLAEYYWSLDPDQAGLSVFRPDAQSKGLRLNTPTTFWRERQPGVQPLRWWMPWRVAGQVARLRRGYGFRCSQAAFLLAQTDQPSCAIAVHNGIIVDERPLSWPDLRGVQLLFDASRFQVDLSNLRLVNSVAVETHLHELRAQLHNWLSERLPSWNFEGRKNNVTSRQSRKEMGAWLSVWGFAVLTGTGMYLPLPLLALPWIVWHHRSRSQLFAIWRKRLQELSPD